MNKVLNSWLKRYLSRPEAVALLVIFTFMLIVFKTMSSILAPIIIAITASYLLFGLVRWLERLGCSLTLAVIIVFAIFMGMFLLLLFWVLPLIWSEMVNLAAEIPTILHRSQELVVKIHGFFPELISVEKLQQLVVQFTEYLANFGREILTFSLSSLLNLATVAVYLVLVPLLIFFFMRDGKRIISWIAGFLPQRRQALHLLWLELQTKIRGYIQGKLIEILVVALVTILAFKILGLQYAALLGVLVGLSVVVPYVGVIVVTIPVVIVGLIQWGMSEHFGYLILVYSVISLLDAYLLVPILFSEVMNLHPLAILLSVLVFGNLFGFWGVFFAIPLITLVNLLIKSWPKEE